MISKSVVDYVFIAQPALYTIMNNQKAPTFGKVKIYSNIQEEYFEKTGKSIVQASLFVNNNSNRAQVKSFLKSLENDISTILETPEVIKEALDVTSEANQTLYGINFNACIDLINDNNAIGLGYKKAIENKNNIDEFIKLFNVGETSEEIYF